MIHGDQLCVLKSWVVSSFLMSQILRLMDFGFFFSTAIGHRTGPVSAGVPAPTAETKAAIKEAMEADVTAPHRRPAGEEPKKVKTEKECMNLWGCFLLLIANWEADSRTVEKERKKAEKEAKFAAKKAQLEKQKATAASSGPVKEKKDKKPKAEPAAPVEYVEETPKGEKKILKSLDDPAYKSYNPIVVESAWYEWWEKEGFFKPELTADGNIKPEGVFVVPAPPPNVTGALHIGHGLTIAIQDTLIRWYVSSDELSLIGVTNKPRNDRNRMLGKTVLFLPGFDHAGISTQSVVEKMLWNREKKTRHDLGREKFTSLVWEWKEEYRNYLLSFKFV